MTKKEQKLVQPLEEDRNAASRKQDHIELAFRSQVLVDQMDQRFYYEPILAGHPETTANLSTPFLGKKLGAPVWVSSMTGGTALARIINQNLARACRDFGMGMGLGSCRSLLYNDDTFEDFNIRPIMGDKVPLFANLGIAQVEQLIERDELDLAEKMLEKLQADGLIIHVNPFQEWLQPEGDLIKVAPLETIQICLDKLACPIIVKEVGQGMGYESLKALFQLPLAAIDFAASGGTNFALLELLRSDPIKQQVFGQLAYSGHSAEDMVNMTNDILKELGDKVACKEVIISGGIKGFLDGHYLINKLATPSIYGQASAFLKYAREDYETLYNYVDSQIRGLSLAKSFLKVR
ncbi:MAG: isopentenyl-diphosphate delta-isomerase [Polaribacter sp.]|jgi:isopentenyl-diphosphate delta-isomerase